MIKVNLLRQQGKGQTAVTSVGTSASVTSLAGLSGGLPAKLIFLFLPILSSYLYNYVVLSQIESDLSAYVQEKKKLDTETAGLQTQLQLIDKFKKEKEGLQKQTDELKGLSLGRYQTVKVLDAIQTILPQKAWLTKLDIINETINIDGSASEDIAISSFIEALDASFYFKDVSWIDSREARAENGELIKVFKLSVKLENL